MLPQVEQGWPTFVGSCISVKQYDACSLFNRIEVALCFTLSIPKKIVGNIQPILMVFKFILFYLHFYNYLLQLALFALLFVLKFYIMLCSSFFGAHSECISINYLKKNTCCMHSKTLNE